MYCTPSVPQCSSMLALSATEATATKPLGRSPATTGSPVCQVLLRRSFWCSRNDCDQPSPLWKNGTRGSSLAGTSSSERRLVLGLG